MAGSRRSITCIRVRTVLVAGDVFFAHVPLDYPEITETQTFKMHWEIEPLATAATTPKGPGGEQKALSNLITQ